MSHTLKPKTEITDKLQDQPEIRDPKIRAAIRKSYQEFVAGQSRPIQELFAQRGGYDTCISAGRTRIRSLLVRKFVS